MSDLELEVIILSPKNYVDLVTKDFARTYIDTMKIYQNEMGYFDKSLKVLNSKSDQRVFILYNKIVTQNDTFTLEKKITNLPVKFNVGSDNKINLQKSLNFVKHFSLLRIYSNNYIKHCVHKVGEEENMTEKESIIDICVIMIENKKNRVKLIH